MKNTVMTEKDAQKSLFEDAIVLPTDAREITVYYLYLLRTAAQLQIIDEETSNKIAGNLMQMIFIEVNQSINAGVNFQYILSSYLMINFSKYEALQRLLQYNGLIEEAKKWFNEKLIRFQSLLAKIQFEIPQEANNIVIANNECINEVELLKKALEYNTKFSFKKAANSCFYDFLRAINYTNYIDYLEKKLKAFYIELSIIKKVKGNELLKFMKEEFEVFNGDDDNSEEERLNRELEEFEKNSKKLWNEGKKIEKQIDKLVEEFDKCFSKENPEIDDLDPRYEEALDEYIESILGEYEPFDESKFLRAYKKQKDNILKKIEEFENRETIDFKKIASQGELFEDDLSLKLLLKEFALVERCKLGMVNYPSTIEERAIAYERISEQDAIEEFLKRFKENLSALEKVYIKSGRTL